MTFSVKKGYLQKFNTFADKLVKPMKIHSQVHIWGEGVRNTSLKFTKVAVYVVLFLDQHLEFVII